MAMVCAQCNQVFYGTEKKCPKCGRLLLLQQHGVKQPDDTLPPPVDPLSRWQQTPWGRIVVSVAIAQGLVYCLQQMTTAWFLASGNDDRGWNSVEGLLILHGYSALALLACGMLAGANQERGATSGGLVGLICGLIFLAMHRASQETLNTVAFFGQPFVQMLWGLIGGWIGRRIWRPVPLFDVDEDMGVTAPLPRFNKKLWKGPIHIVRILIGSVVAIAGAVFAKEILDTIIRTAPPGMFRVTSHLTERLVLYLIIALASLVGGSIAGSSARNGFKQGVFAGVLASALYLGVQLANPKSVLEVTLFTSVAVLAVCIFGGIFGSLLFPPLGKPTPKNTIPY